MKEEDKFHSNCRHNESGFGLRCQKCYRLANGDFNLRPLWQPIIKRRRKPLKAKVRNGKTSK